MARFARQTERSGGQKGRGLWGRNFCPPSLSAAAEIRANEVGAPYLKQLNNKKNTISLYYAINISVRNYSSSSNTKFFIAITSG